jgi:Mannosyl-glycoprotein endo-beta-N-acetylglucosaminidase
MLIKKKTNRTFWTKLAPIWQQISVNWFTYSLVLIILIAIYKKHQAQLEGTLPLGMKQSQVAQQHLGIAPEFAGAYTLAQRQQFLQRFRATARDEAKKYGIPENVILAAALVQSQAGTTLSCQQSHNYFQLKKGGNLVSYQTPWESFRAFSKALVAVKGNQKLKTTESWAHLIVTSDILDVQPNFIEEMESIEK